MRLRVRFDEHESGVAHLTAEGTVSVDDAIATLHELESWLASRDVAGVLVLADDVNLGLIHAPEVRRIASAWSRAQIPETMPIAFVADDLVVYGVLRMLVAFREAPNARVFRDRQDAVAWIDAARPAHRTATT